MFQRKFGQYLYKYGYTPNAPSRTRFEHRLYRIADLFSNAFQPWVIRSKLNIAKIAAGILIIKLILAPLIPAYGAQASASIVFIGTILVTWLASEISYRYIAQEREAREFNSIVK